MRQIAILLLLTASLMGCAKVQVSKHDPNKAVEDASATLKVLFLENNVDAAYPMFDDEFRNVTTKEEMSSMLGQTAASVGPMTELQAQAYAPIYSQKAMTIFYKGTHERGVSYFRVVVSGDSGGYRIDSLNVSGIPYPEAQSPDVHYFEQPIVMVR